MKKSEPFIQLQQSLKAVAERVAAAEGVSPYQLINIAVSEKLSALETEDFFKGARQARQSGGVSEVLR